MKEHDQQQVLKDSCNTTVGECWGMYISVVFCFVLFYSQKSHHDYPFPDCGRLSELGNRERLSAFPAPAGKKVSLYSTYSYQLALYGYRQ